MPITVCVLTAALVDLPDAHVLLSLSPRVSASLVRLCARVCVGLCSHALLSGPGLSVHVCLCLLWPPVCWARLYQRAVACVQPVWLRVCDSVL